MPENPYIVVPIIITACSPLTFPTRKPGTQFQKSLDYIPGAALYGALGAHCFEPERFERIRCHNAYPRHAGDDWVRPLPATAIQPKGTEDKQQDSLVPRICWEQQQPAALIYGPTDKEGRSWEAAGAKYYTLRDGALYTPSVTQRVLTRVAINRRRGTAEDQRLYSLLAINEVTNKAPTQFVGTLCIHPDDKTPVIDALKKITHLGGRQTTGLGAVHIDIVHEKETNPESAADIHGRIEQLTRRFQEQAELYASMCGTPWTIKDAAIFTINLLSDAILLDQGWLPTQEFTASMLKEHTGIEANLLRAFTSTAVVGGWNVSWQRPKPTHYTTTKGGVFVFQAEQSLDEAACARLAQLQLDGIGERRPEGYGQIRICDEFHTWRSNDE